MATEVLREQTVGSVGHPDHLLAGELSLCDLTAFPTLSVLTDGDPGIGWEGDARLAMYHGPEGRYYLLRMEHDGQYRIVCRSEPFGIGFMGQEGLQKLCRDLMSKDVRRGVDVGAQTIAHNEKIDADRDAQFNELIDEEIAPRLAHMVGHMYLPGLDIRTTLR